MAATPAATEQQEIVVKESFEELQSEFTDTALERITLDSVAVMRLIKDCMDAQPDMASGALLGMENGTTLEITNSYPLYDDVAEGEDSMSDTIMRCYREANFDVTEVGWYITPNDDNSFFSVDTISAQFDWQTRRNPKAVLLVFDPFRMMLEGATGSQPLALHAYRLTQEFVALYKTGKFSVENLATHKVSYKHIFEEIPIYIRPAFPSAIGSLLQRAEADPELQSDRSLLDTMVSPLVERSVDSLIKKFDQMETQQRTFAGYQRNIVMQLRRFYKGYEYQIPTQPSQLDSLLLTSQMTSFCDQTLNAATDSTAKLYFVNDVLKEK